MPNLRKTRRGNGKPMASKYDFRGANSFLQNNGDFPLPSLITRGIQYANLLFNRQTVTNSPEGPRCLLKPQSRWRPCQTLEKHEGAMENPWLLSMIFAGPIVSYKTMGIFHCQVWLHVVFNMQTCYSTGRLWQIQGNCNGVQRIAMEQLLSCQLIPPATSKCCEHRLLTNPTKIVRTNMLHACQAQGSSVVCTKWLPETIAKQTAGQTTLQNFQDGQNQRATSQNAFL